MTSHQQTTSTTQQPTSAQVPSQLTIIDLDPTTTSQSHHPPSASTLQNQTTAATFPDIPSTVPSSLSRSVLPNPSAHPSNSPSPNAFTNVDSGWRRRFFEQMNRDFEIGLDRSQAIHRLRQRLNMHSSRLSSSSTTPNHRANHQRSSRANPLPTPPSTSEFGSRNLVDILRQVRLQRDSLSRKVNSHYAYLLYCGSTPDQRSNNNSASQNVHNSGEGDSGGGNPFGEHLGCGRLISIRATLMTPKPTRGFMNDEVMDSYSSILRRSVSEHLLLTSDSFPVPNAVDKVDSTTQEAFEADPTNLFYRGSSNHIRCSCERTYLGCLSCGNIVGHTVTTLCRQCQEHSTLYPHSYYLNRLTPIPRYVNRPIPSNLQEARAPIESADLKLMSWTQALLRKKSDTDAGYVGTNLNNRSQLPASIAFTDGLAGDLPHRLSEKVRNAILIGSLDGVLENSMDISRNPFGISTSFNAPPAALIDYPNHLSVSPIAPRQHPNIGSSSATLSTLSSTMNNHLSVRAGLARRPAVRISHHSGTRSRPRTRPRIILDSEMWSEGSNEQSQDEEEVEFKEEEEMFIYRSGSTRRPRSDDDDEDDNRREERSSSGSGQEDTSGRRINDEQNTNNRVVRRRLDRNLSDSQDDNSTLLKFSSSFTWSGDVCAR